MSLQTAIRTIVARLLPPQVVVGKVLKVDTEKFTCDVEFTNQPTIYNVRLRAVVEEDPTGPIMIPKVGSRVVVDTIQGHQMMCYVAMMSEVEELFLSTPSSGGIPVASKLAERLEILEKHIEGFQSVISKWQPKIDPAKGGDGLLSLQIDLEDYLKETIEATKVENISNPNITIGA